MEHSTPSLSPPPPKPARKEFPAASSPSDVIQCEELQPTCLICLVSLHAIGSGPQLSLLVIDIPVNIQLQNDVFTVIDILLSLLFVHLPQSPEYVPKGM